MLKPFWYNQPMFPHALNRLPTLSEIEAYTPQQVLEVFRHLSTQIAHLQQQLEWLKREVFGQKSERRLVESPPGQMSFSDLFPADDTPAAPVPTQDVAAHRRATPAKDPDSQGEALPFFDATRVPVEIIELKNPQTEGLSPQDYEVIAYKDTYRLAQRPASYVVLHYRRAVVKLHATQTLVTPAAPIGVLDPSRADVSFIAGLLVDKFCYHLPLYRQHQRLIDCGFHLSRSWLSKIVSQAVVLLDPIYQAQWASIMTSRVKAMDETPIKAGRAAQGKMKAAYFWPVYGERDEICFPYSDNRRHANVETLLGRSLPNSVLLSDGYAAYAEYAKRCGLTHAQCWAHTRRHFFNAQNSEPQAVAQALEQIGALYAVEEQIRQQKLSGSQKQQHRVTHAKPLVEQFFGWIDQQLSRQGGWLPSNPFTHALHYARERRVGLKVYLTDPDVAIDTNHLERALRTIPMGRKAWLFCWSEVGAKEVGLIQSLMTTCKLHQINPYDYLVDVLLRISQLPTSEVDKLTPRLWKQHFAHQMLRSDLA